VLFPALAFEIVRFTVPGRYLAEVTFSGATYDTDGALDRGWIDEIAEPEDLMEDALAVAQEIAELSPPTFALTKAQIGEAVIERMEKTGAATEKAVTEIWCAPETHARIRDYVARMLRK
jgi:enoyl-CoA hydratase